MSAEVREWARKNGFDVGSRGRLKPEILAAYAAAGGTFTDAPSDDPKDMVARPTVIPGLVESFEEDTLGVARAYIPEADRDDLTQALIDRARSNRAAIVDVGGKLKLYANSEPPSGSLVLLDWRGK